MKTTFAAAALALHVADAFPSSSFSAPEVRAAKPVGDGIFRRQIPNTIPPFDAKVQHVSNTGDHAFQAPSSTDQRGPCPGLNAMANHGYFPKNGVGDLTDFIQGTADAFGMGTDLSGFLAVYGAVFDGNLLEYSIGGPVADLTNLGGLLGEPEGLSGSHNKYEGDVSPIRGDLYTHKNDYENAMDQFKRFYELGMQNGGRIDLQVITDYRAERFNQSISTNPYFFNAPFSGVVASPAAWSFIYRFMANKTEEYPQGILDLETLKSFYAVTGDYPNFSYTPGHERIPDNWYKRNPVDYYTIPYLILDAVPMLIAHPELASVGGNTGTVNSFVGLEPANLTDGVFNIDTLFEGNNAFCYGLEVAGQMAPDILTGLYTDVNQAMDVLGPVLNNVTDSLGCPKLNNYNKNQFGQFPGWTKLKSDGSY